MHPGASGDGATGERGGSDGLDDGLGSEGGARLGPGDDGPGPGDGAGLGPDDGPGSEDGAGYGTWEDSRAE